MSILDTGKSIGKFGATMASRSLVSMILWGLVWKLICIVFNIIFFWVPILYTDKMNKAIEKAEKYFKDDCALYCQHCGYWVPRTEDVVCPVCNSKIDMFYLHRKEARDAGFGNDDDAYWLAVREKKVVSPIKERWSAKEKRRNSEKSSSPVQEEQKKITVAKPSNKTPQTGEIIETEKVPGKDIYIIHSDEILNSDGDGVVNHADNNTYAFQEQFREKNKNVRCPKCNHGFTHVTQDLGQGNQIRQCNKCWEVFGYDYQLQEMADGPENRFA